MPRRDKKAHVSYTVKIIMQNNHQAQYINVEPSVSLMHNATRGFKSFSSKDHQSFVSIRERSARHVRRRKTRLISRSSVDFSGREIYSPWEYGTISIRYSPSEILFVVLLFLRVSSNGHFCRLKLIKILLGGNGSRFYSKYFNVMLIQWINIYVWKFCIFLKVERTIKIDSLLFL